VLAAATPDRTVAIVSTSPVPTIAMVTDQSVEYPAPGELRARIDEQTRAGENRYLDARVLATRLLGSAGASNVLLLGVAVQAGLIPVSVAGVRRAIELNGVAVATNLAAFDWGRAWEHDRRAVESAAGLAAADGSPTPGAVEELIAKTGLEGPLRHTVARRATDLHAYQGSRLVTRYLDLVEATRRTESRLGPDTEISDSVARGFHKLLAYKDEYEVARLMLDPQERAQVARDSGIADPVISYNLHPPVLRALGMGRKIRLGPWANPVLRVLRGARRLRGTRLDPFGYAEVRRIERALIEEYEGAIRGALEHLHSGNRGQVLDLARTPELVRGYEDIKTASVTRFRAAVAAVRSEIHPTKSEEVG
jgi:indolepyruvate ferredoxin oxidoreductase